jgi:hypothetical protein
MILHRHRSNRSPSIQQCADGNPNNLESLVNFSKREKIASVIHQLLRLQRSKFVLGTDEAMLRKLLDLQPKVDETRAYTLSLKIEPRDTSEAIEQLMIEEERLRIEVERLNARVLDVESENNRLQQAVALLTKQNMTMRRALAMTTSDIGATAAAAAAGGGNEQLRPGWHRGV